MPYRPAVRRARELDLPLALALLSTAAGALVWLLFAAEWAALRAWGAPPLYLVALPASLALARWRQIAPPPRPTPALVPPRLRAVRRPAGTRRRFAQRRLRRAVAATGGFLPG